MERYDVYLLNELEVGVDSEGSFRIDHNDCEISFRTKNDGEIEHFMDELKNVYEVYKIRKTELKKQRVLDLRNQKDKLNKQLKDLEKELSEAEIEYNTVG